MYGRKQGKKICIYKLYVLPIQIRGFKCLCPANFKGTACEEKSSPGDPSDPCGDITCKSGEACVVLEADEQKCELCDNNGEQCVYQACVTSLLYMYLCACN